MIPIKERERTAIINSLKSGVVPRIGLQHIHVGRNKELRSVLNDLETIKDNGSTIRFIAGEFGSGKTFFLTLVTNCAQKEGFVTTKVDITTEKCLYNRQGKAKATYRELISNLSTKEKSEGGALTTVIDKWINDNQIDINSSDFEKTITDKLRSLSDYVSGNDFATVIACYLKAYRNNDSDLMDNCLRWLRAEYATKSDAKKDLPVSSIIDDSNYYEYLKLWSAFIRQTSYKGFLICIDELGVLSNYQKAAREKNFETILKIINDSLQGTNKGLMFLMGGTTEFITDSKKGLYSYDALKTRLQSNPYETEDIIDYNATVLTLQKLSNEHLFCCLKNIRNVFARYDENKYLMQDEELLEHFKICYERLGASTFAMTRDVIKDTVGLLSLLEQDDSLTWEILKEKKESPVKTEKDDFEGFKL